jgi:hypothetical protein
MHGYAIIIFVGAAMLAAYFGSSSWNGTVYVSNGMYTSEENARTPAAIRKVFDFSHLEGTALTSALQNRLLSDVKVMSQEGQVGIELGHFVTHNEAGDKVFACQYYNRVELSFVADGVIEGGERPTMVVEGPCSFSANINRIDAIWIPVAKILAEQPGNMELTFNDSTPVNLRFRNVGVVWPKNWSLFSIRMFDQEKTGHEITVGEGEMRRLFSRLIPIQF